MKKSCLLCAAAALLLSIVNSVSEPAWQAQLREQLPLLGHRNWIVVTDAAYPLQTSPGVETLYVDADQLQVVEGVLAELARTKHVRPTVYTDSELKYVAEKNAPGIGVHRDRLQRLLADLPASVLPHESLIARVDEAGKTFKILVIKTPQTLPYTSVFLQLDCGYWTAQAEKELRAAIKAAETKP